MNPLPKMAKKISLRIDASTFKELAKLSEYYAISNSDLIRMLIKDRYRNVSQNHDEKIKKS